VVVYIRNLLITCAIICLTTYVVCRKEQQLQRRISCMLMLSTCSLLVFWLTGTTPRSGFQPEIDWSSVQMIPLRGIKTVLYYGFTFYAFENILGNIIMMMPIGFLLPLFFRHLRKWYQVGLIGGAMSLLIEVSQLFLWRGTDIDDVLLNVVGTLAGYIVWKLSGNKLDRWVGLEEAGKKWNALWSLAMLIPYFTEVALGFLDILMRRFQ